MLPARFGGVLPAKRIRIAQGIALASLPSHYRTDLFQQGQLAICAKLRQGILGVHTSGERTLADRHWSSDVQQWMGAAEKNGCECGEMNWKQRPPVDILKRPNESAFPVNCEAYASLLRHCGTRKALSAGRGIHNRIIKDRFERNAYLGNLLLQMYAKCQCLDDARVLFVRMHQRDVFSFNFIIGAYVSHGDGMEAFQCFEQMLWEGVKPDKFTFVSLLSTIASQADLTGGKQMHARITKSGVELDVVMGTALINMYGNCGSSEDAQSVFDRMTEWNVASWTAIIAAYARQGKSNYALQLFYRMQQSGVIADKVCFLSLLSACANQATLAECSQLHAQINIFGFESDSVVGNALVNMYGKCGSLENACRLFNGMLGQTVVSWTTMITLYAQHGNKNEALQLFKQMQTNGVIPNDVSFIHVLDVCAGESLAEGRQVHTSILGSGCEINFDIGTALIKMYAKCGSLEDAQKMFYEMLLRNVVSWMAIIAAYTKLGKRRDVLQFFTQMQQEGILPDTGCLISILTVCADLGLSKVKQMHATIAGSGGQVGVLVANSLINMYGRWGSLEDAQRVFDDIQDHNIVSWNIMIGVYVQHGKGNDVLRLFDQMQYEGTMPDKVTFINILSAFSCPAALAEGMWIHSNIMASRFCSDVVLGNAVVTMYGNCGSLESAQCVFDQIHDLDVVSWTALITAYAEHGRAEEALQVFDQMQLEGVTPDKVTFISILDACANQGVLTKGKQRHVNIIAIGCESDIVIGTALVNMYGKCGNLDAAWMVFNSIYKQDVISWTAMIAACAWNGEGKKVLRLFGQMLRAGVRPNSVTFLSILGACSHAGLVEEGCYVFTSMVHDHNITPVVCHHNCMIDLLGRAGLVKDADALIKNMLLMPSVASWMSLLGACRIHLDAQGAERAAKGVYELHPEEAHHLPFLVLAFVMAESALHLRSDDRNSVRRLLCK